ncbi:hypothetical protein LTR95_002031 [Oleoguttula sp. CCFEE 5521]
MVSRRFTTQSVDARVQNKNKYGTTLPGVVAPIRAVTAVLKTAEILERILLQLEPRQIFTLQRVSVPACSFTKASRAVLVTTPEAGSEYGSRALELDKDPLCWVDNEVDAKKNASPESSILNIQLCNPPCDTWVIRTLFVTFPSAHNVYAELVKPVKLTGCSTMGEILGKVFDAKAWAGLGSGFEEIVEGDAGKTPPEDATLEQVQRAVGFRTKSRVNLESLDLHPAGTVITNEEERREVV